MHGMSMKFSAYIEREGRGSIQRVARDSGVSYQAVWYAKNGQPISRYVIAKKISLATGGEVTIKNLCEPESEPEAA